MFIQTNRKTVCIFAKGDIYTIGSNITFRESTHHFPIGLIKVDLKLLKILIYECHEISFFRASSLFFSLFYLKKSRDFSIISTASFSLFRILPNYKKS